MDIKDIWQQYAIDVKKFLHSKVSNPSDVDDILQDIFTKIFKSLPTLTSIDKFKPWMFQVTRNTVIDYYRKKGRVTEVELLDLFSSSLEEEETIEKDLSRCIQPFINHLPDEARELLMAIDIYGLSQKAYAKEHGIKYSTLKSRVKKSRLLLYQLFSDCCHYSFDRNGSLIDYSPKLDQCHTSCECDDG